MSQSSTLAPSLTAFLQSDTGWRAPARCGGSGSWSSRGINKIAELAAQNGISQTALGAVTGEENADGDDQKHLMFWLTS